MTNKIDIVLKAITDQIAGTLPSDTVKNPKLSTSLVLSTRSYPNIDPQYSNHVQSSINTITIHSEKQSDSYDENTKEKVEQEKDSRENIHVNPSTPLDPEGEPKEEGNTTTEGVGVKYFDMFLTKSVVRFTSGTEEVAYKMPHMIEQYNSMSDLEKEHTKSVYLRNKEDKRRGV
nr:hypothetical protein [Tanacetum cinerariifolium]